MYLRNPKFEGEFDGKKIVAVMNQLTFEDAMVFEAMDDSVSDAAKNVEFARVLAKRLPAYVTEFDGPLDSNGVPVGIEEVCSTAYFARLVVAIGKKLVESASPPREPPVAFGS